MIEVFHASAGGGWSTAPWAALVSDDTLRGFAFEPPRGALRYGDIHVAMVRTVDSTRGMAFVSLVDEAEAVVDVPHSGGLAEGSLILLQIRRTARGSKRARAKRRVEIEGLDGDKVAISGSLADPRIEQTAPADRAPDERLARIAEAIVPAIRNARQPVLIRPGRCCVADLIYRFPDLLPAAIVTDTRVSAETIRRDISADPAGRNIPVEFAPTRDWRYDPAMLHDMLNEILEPRQMLAGGGSILVEPVETLTAIDVDAGNAASISGGERMIVDVNRRAAREIARTVRCRNLSGNIVIDFIGMREKRAQRDLVELLRAEFVADPAQPWIGSMSPIGLVEMSRRDMGPGPVMPVPD